MGNPYPAEFEDHAGVERLVGTIDFTDPGNQPGGGFAVTDGTHAVNPAAVGQFQGFTVSEPVPGTALVVPGVNVPVSSAEILDLANTPVVLVPGLPGFVTVVTGVAIVYLAGATPYTDNGGSLQVAYAGNVSGQFAVVGAGFWDQATSQFSAAGYGQTEAGAAATYDGLDLVLLVDMANPTLGDGTLSVTVSYFLAPTA